MADAEGPDETPDREPADSGWGGTTFVAGVVLGALIGAGIALLVAPVSGAVTRRRLGVRARELGDRAREGLEEATHRARRDLLRRRKRLQSKLDRLTEDPL